jgi:hypothetical protein
MGSSFHPPSWRACLTAFGKVTGYQHWRSAAIGSAIGGALGALIGTTRSDGCTSVRARAAYSALWWA